VLALLWTVALAAGAAAAGNVGRVAMAVLPEPAVREMTPRFKAHLWGYNGQSPGPTIEVARWPGTFMYHPHAD